jgi:hypothetical protein
VGADSVLSVAGGQAEPGMRDVAPWNCYTGCHPTLEIDTTQTPSTLSTDPAETGSRVLPSTSEPFGDLCDHFDDLGMVCRIARGYRGRLQVFGTATGLLTDHSTQFRSNVKRPDLGGVRPIRHASSEVDSLSL